MMLLVVILWCVGFVGVVAMHLPGFVDSLRMVTDHHEDDEALADWHDTLVWTSNGWADPNAPAGTLAA